MRSLLGFLLLIATTAPLVADDYSTINRTVEIGPGTGLKSATKSFPVPVNVTPGVLVTLKRVGEAGAANDLPIALELRVPGTSPGAQGQIIASKTVTVKTTNQTFELEPPAMYVVPRGCGQPWTVTVKYVDKNTSSIVGNIALRYFDRPRSIAYASSQSAISPANIPKGGTVRRAIIQPRQSGTIRIKAEWHTDPLDILHFNTYYKLTVRLLRNGTVVASGSGYSRHAPADKTPKLAVTYFIPPEQALDGDWAIEVESGADVNIVDFRTTKHDVFESTFQVGCQ